VLTGSETEGERIRIEGRIFDGTGSPVRDMLVEIWQANAAGRYNHPADRQEGKPLDPSFRGWGRTGTDFETGLYMFETIKPGSVSGRRGRGLMAPHVNFWLVARGVNIGLSTRMYFVDEETANAEDPVLRMIEPALRRDTRCRRAGKSGIARRSTCSTSTSRARGKRCFSTLEDRNLATRPVVVEVAIRARCRAKRTIPLCRYDRPA
jgi:protocatechuate 3,4-dioxygenase alpha subunit